MKKIKFKSLGKIFLIIFFMFFAFNKNINAKSTTQTGGDYLQLMLPAYALGLAINENGFEGIKQFSYTFISTQLITHLLKFSIDEKRPDYKVGDRKDSFPSGHTSSAFSAATFIHKRYGIKEAVIPYFLASFVGFSRIKAEKHYAHDVLAGILISSAFTWIFVDEYNNNCNLSLTNNGIQLSYKVEF